MHEHLAPLALTYRSEELRRVGSRPGLLMTHELERSRKARRRRRRPGRR